MAAPDFPSPMRQLPHPGQHVRWRHPEHVRVYGWPDVLGQGPFEVVEVVDHAAQEIPRGVVLKTRRGEREVNEVWLELAD